jgi:hypothetical protein
MKRFLVALIWVFLVFGNAWGQPAPTYGPGGGSGCTANCTISGNLTLGGALSPHVRVISAGSSDTALTTDYGINWNSSSGAPKSETLPACNSTSTQQLVVSDEYGDSWANPITVTPLSGTINGQSYYPLSAAGGASWTIGCDGVSNWVFR